MPHGGRVPEYEQHERVQWAVELSVYWLGTTAERLPNCLVLQTQQHQRERKLSKKMEQATAKHVQSYGHRLSHCDDLMRRPRRGSW